MNIKVAAFTVSEKSSNITPVQTQAMMFSLVKSCISSFYWRNAVNTIFFSSLLLSNLYLSHFKYKLNWLSCTQKGGPYRWTGGPDPAPWLYDSLPILVWNPWNLTKHSMLDHHQPAAASKTPNLWCFTERAKILLTEDVPSEPYVLVTKTSFVSVGD